MAKTKRLNAKQVEAELRLIFLGADGDYLDETVTIPSAIQVDATQRSYYAILSRWFPGDRAETRIGDFGWLNNWESIQSLAAFIVAERKRLDAKGEA